MKHWRGMLETIEEVDAETEEEAKKKIAEKIIAALQEEDTSVMCWEVYPR